MSVRSGVFVDMSTKGRMNATRQRLATIDVNSDYAARPVVNQTFGSHRLRAMSYRERRTNQENEAPSTSSQRKLTDGGSVLIRKRAMMPPPMRRLDGDKSPAVKLRSSKSAVEDVSPVRCLHLDDTFQLSHYNLRKRHSKPWRDPNQTLITEFVPHSKHTQKALTMHRCYSETSVSSNGTSIDLQSEDGDPDRKLLATSLSTLNEDMSETCDDRSLVGDRSRAYALPEVRRPSRQDCRGIHGDTLAQLINGEITLPVGRSFRVIDCRYPYEFDDGHVQGAENMYMQTTMTEKLFGNVGSNAGDQSTILIFYCEFSQERGPRMLRAVRNNDRAHNAWPKLCYPEMYLVEHGYRNFFARQKTLCTPLAYTPMLSKPEKLQEMKRFLSTSSSINRAVTRSVTRQMESPPSTVKPGGGAKRARLSVADRTSPSRRGVRGLFK